MLWAAEHGRVDVIKALREMGADISAKDHGGWTPMHNAAMHGCVDAIKVLREMGADILAKGNSERTPMYWDPYDYVDTDDVFDELEKMGVDTSSIDENKWTPMLWAAKNRQASAMEVLMEMEVDTD